MPPVPPARRPLFAPLWSALRALRAVFLIACYLVVLPSSFLPWLLFLLFFRGDAEARARVLQRTSARGVRFMHWWLRVFRVIRFDWREVKLALPPGPCVIVANHPIQLDPTVLMAVLVHAVSLVKPSIFRRRFVRPILEGAGHIEGPDLDPATVGTAIDTAVRRLRVGMHVFVFPEAKRSPQGRLRPFGRIAFEIAARAQVPLVSIALRCEPCYLSRETPLLLPPPTLPRVSVAILAIDEPAAFGDDSKALKERVEGRYKAWVADGMPPLAASAATSPAPSRSSMRPATGA
ncbi:MAG: lysophospholipid acyltransferase family protein [Planctomycetota bacterium]